MKTKIKFPGNELNMSLSSNQKIWNNIVCNLYHNNIHILLQPGYTKNITTNYISTIQLFNCYEFYILNTASNLKIQQMFISKKKDIIDFLVQNINYKLYYGLDIIVTTDDFKNILIFNHDGEVYLKIK